MAFFTVLCALFSSSWAQTNYIPPQAFQYKQEIKDNLDEYFPQLAKYNYVPALIEHESCISLKHKRCWNPASELLTKRENGVGFFMVTRAWDEQTGAVRFDSLTDMKNKYKDALKEASWGTFKARPDLQIRMGVLMLRDNHKALYSIKDQDVRMQMMDAAHNAGLGNVMKKRRACGIKKDCDPQLWYDNTENECIGHTRKLYGNRSACDIVKNHVRDTILIRMPKYEAQYFTKKDTP